jgi:predicted transposase YbfD/YdcC
MIRSERRLGETVEIKTRYFISSAVMNAKAFLKAKRSHWGIENRLHWVLDVAFREDVSRVRKDHGPANFAVLRHMALNMLKQEKSAKVGMFQAKTPTSWLGRRLLAQGALGLKCDYPKAHSKRCW